jgi:hypothetical protein
MGSQTKSSVSTDGANQGAAPGGATMRGRIEAIGIQELLRISAIKGGTGRLLVFNDHDDAELYYEQGRLVAAVSGSNSGRDCLQQALQMHDGEFEFAPGITAAPEHKLPNLHEGMVGAIRDYYEKQTPAGDARPSSGVHKVSPEKGAPGPPPKPASASSADRAAPKEAPDSELAPGELGAAVIDVGGRVLRRSGSFSQHDAGLAALAFKISARLSGVMGARDLHGFEIHVPGNKALICASSSEGLRISKTSADADTESTWKRLRQ